MKKLWNELNRPITWKHAVIATILSMVLAVPYTMWVLRDLVSWPKWNPFRRTKFVDPADDGMPIIPAEE